MLHELFEEHYPSFAPEELLSPDGLILFESGTLPMQVVFLNMLQGLRNIVGRPFLINHGEHKRRGFRSKRENDAVGGKFAHPLGIAADVTVKGLSPKEFGEVAKDFGFSGIGVYNTFTHIDIRNFLGFKSAYWRVNR